MPNQLGPGGGGLVEESSSHKWRRKILKLTQDDFEYQHGILMPRPVRSDYATDINAVFNRRSGSPGKIGRQATANDIYQEIDLTRPIGMISRSADGRFKLHDPEVNRTDYVTLDPTTHARDSHIQGSHEHNAAMTAPYGRHNYGRLQREKEAEWQLKHGSCQEPRRSQSPSSTQANWDYVQFYHPQYYSTQQQTQMDTQQGLGLGLSHSHRAPYPRVHLAALEAAPRLTRPAGPPPHRTPGAPGPGEQNHMDDNGFIPVGSRASVGRRKRELRRPQSGVRQSRFSPPPAGRSLHRRHDHRPLENREQGVHPHVFPVGSRESIGQRRSRSADSYHENYANYHGEYESGEHSSPRDSRALRRRPGEMRLASSSAPATPGHRSRSQSRDRDDVTPMEHQYDQFHPHSNREHVYCTPQRGRTPFSQPSSSRSRHHTTPLSRGTPHSRGTAGTPGADYKSFLTSSPDAADGSAQPFLISDVSSVLPGSSLMTSTNQMPSSIVTSPSLQTPSGYSGLDDSRTPRPRSELISHSATPDPGRNQSLLHQRSLSEGDGTLWKNPQWYLYSGAAPLAEEKVDVGIYSPRTEEFISRYMADEDRRALRGKAHPRPLLPQLQVHLTPETQDYNGSSPEELAYTRDKLDKAIKHVRKGRLQPPYGHSAPELDIEPRSPGQWTPDWAPNAGDSGSDHQLRNMFDHSVAPYKSYGMEERNPRSQDSSSGRGSSGHIAGTRPTTWASQGALYPDHNPSFRRGRDPSSSQDTTHSTSGVGSKDTSRSVSSQDGPTIASHPNVSGRGDGHLSGSQNHVFSGSHEETHQRQPRRSFSSPGALHHAAAADSPQFDSALEAQLLGKLQRRSHFHPQPSQEGAAGVDGHAQSDPHHVTSNTEESPDEKFERLRKEYQQLHAVRSGNQCQPGLGPDQDGRSAPPQSGSARLVEDSDQMVPRPIEPFQMGGAESGYSLADIAKHWDDVKESEML